nr:histone deacetylase 14 [Tanacetum cinerariifolium]
MADVNDPSDQTPTMAPPRKHRFHPRPDSPLHLSNEEPVLGYLKFSTKGTKREIFGMPIPRKLITANIREAPYYQEYQENVAKHKGFLAGETGSTQDLPAPKLAKPARKPYASRKTRQPRSSPTSVGASEAEEVPAEELQGPLPPVVIRDPESGKYRPLPEVPGKGKAKVSKEQVAHDLLSLQKYKKTSPADQYIFQSEEKSEKIVLGVEKGGQDEGQAGPDPNAQAKGQTRLDTGAQAEGHAGSNPDETSEG